MLLLLLLIILLIVLPLHLLSSLGLLLVFRGSVRASILVLLGSHRATFLVLLDSGGTVLTSLKKDAANINEVGTRAEWGILTHLVTVRPDSGSSSSVNRLILLDILQLAVGQTIIFLADLCLINPKGSEDLSTTTHGRLRQRGVLRWDEIGHLTVKRKTEGIARAGGSFIPSEVRHGAFFLFARASQVGLSKENVLFILFQRVE
jgi:hypothetical protein